MAESDEGSKISNGGPSESEAISPFIEIKRDGDETLYDVLRGFVAGVLSPETDSSPPPTIINRIRSSLSKATPRLGEASRRSAGDLILWARRGSPFRTLFVISVGTITLLALTGLLVFLLFFLIATLNAAIIAFLISLAAAGGFLALFFACLTAIYIGALSLAVFVISATTLSTTIAVTIATENMSSNSDHDDSSASSTSTTESEEINRSRGAAKREATINLACLLTIQAYYDQQNRVRMPLRTSTYTGYQWVLEVINHPNPERCHQAFRMESHVFKRLCEQLRHMRLLRNTRNVCVEEQVAIFLGVVGHNNRNRESQEQFQRSGDTIHRHFHSVLNAMIEWSTTMITPPSFGTMHDHIRNNNKFFPHFKDCIGALDGTHIHAQVPLDVQHIYRGRKGPTTQNVLAVCDFDMRFTFVYAGWEGSANDARILGEAIRNPDLQFPKPPPGKYYLVDAGYANQIGYLAPYKNVKYHLQDFRRTGRARNEKELFNHAHSALRNIIERCFGVLKARFPILTLMAKYDLATQREIVIACMTLHNFIRKEQMHDAFEEQYGPGYVGPDPELEETVGTSSAAAHQVHPSSHRPMDVFRTELSQIIRQRSLSCQLGL